MVIFGIRMPSAIVFVKRAMPFSTSLGLQMSGNLRGAGDICARGFANQDIHELDKHENHITLSHQSFVGSLMIIYTRPVIPDGQHPPSVLATFHGDR